MLQLEKLPSKNPENFTQFQAGGPPQVKLVVYRPTHSLTQPPSHQVIGTEQTNILLRHLYKLSANAKGKRPATEGVATEKGAKSRRTRS